MSKSNYSVEGNYRIGNKIIFEERNYDKASSFEEAIKMAKEDGNIGPGIVFHNLEEPTRKRELGDLFNMEFSKN